MNKDECSNFDALVEGKVEIFVVLKKELKKKLC